MILVSHGSKSDQPSRVGKSRKLVRSQMAIRIFQQERYTDMGAKAHSGNGLDPQPGKERRRVLVDGIPGRPSIVCHSDCGPEEHMRTAIIEQVDVRGGG